VVELVPLLMLLLRLATQRALLFHRGMVEWSERNRMEEVPANAGTFSTIRTMNATTYVCACATTLL